MDRVLITGADGMLGGSLAHRFASNGSDILALNRYSLDVTDYIAINEVFSNYNPRYVLHTAGLVNADHCESNPEFCYKTIYGGTENIVRACEKYNSILFYPQSFLIHESSYCPITEKQLPSPCSHYANMKYKAQILIQDLLPEYLILCLGGFYGGLAKDKNFVGKFYTMLTDALGDSSPSLEIGSRIWQPTFTRDISCIVYDALKSNLRGYYNFAPYNYATFFEVAEFLVKQWGLMDRVSILHASKKFLSDLDTAKRPSSVILDSSHLSSLIKNPFIDWRTSLQRYAADPFFTSRMCDYAV